MNRILCWFSCGAASAVATKLTIDRYSKTNEIIVVRNIVREEHPDNERFASDCEKWFGQKIVNTLNEKYDGSIYNVFEAKKYIAGIYGAPCTMELKKEVRRKFQKPGDFHVFGFTLGEEHRVERILDNNNDMKLIDILIDQRLTHSDCLHIIGQQGIVMPEMYRLGYKNNNCIGCVKGQAGYWNKIRVDFPDQFKRMAALEKKFGARLTRYKGERVFLDDLPPDYGRYSAEKEVQCGIFCETAVIELKNARKGNQK